MKNKLLKNISLEGIFADFAVILVGYLINYNIGWFQDNITWIFWSIGILQTLMIYSIFIDQSKTGIDFDKLPDFVTAIYGLSMILGIGGFMWIFLPADALDIPNSMVIGSVNIFVALIGSLLALGYAMEKEESSNFFDKYIVLIIPAIYLSVSELLILMSSKAENMPVGVVIFVIAISYLPIRILYMIKPPNSKIEMLTALSAFSYFIYLLF